MTSTAVHFDEYMAKCPPMFLLEFSGDVESGVQVFDKYMADWSERFDKIPCASILGTADAGLAMDFTIHCHQSTPGLVDPELQCLHSFAASVEWLFVTGGFSNVTDIEELSTMGVKGSAKGLFQGLVLSSSDGKHHALHPRMCDISFCATFTLACGGVGTNADAGLNTNANKARTVVDRDWIHRLPPAAEPFMHDFVTSQYQWANVRCEVAEVMEMEGRLRNAIEWAGTRGRV